MVSVASRDFLSVLRWRRWCRRRREWRGAGRWGSWWRCWFGLAGAIEERGHGDGEEVGARHRGIVGCFGFEREKFEQVGLGLPEFGGEEAGEAMLVGDSGEASVE